jgi:hypothetical protein
VKPRERLRTRYLLDAFPLSITQWSRVFLKKLLVAQLVKKFAAFYGIQKFITVLTRADPILSKMNPVHILTSRFFKIHFNIILLPVGVPSSLQVFRPKFCMNLPTS